MREHHIKVKAGVLQVSDFGRTQMATGQAGVFNHNGVWQAAFLLPFANQELNATGIGQNRNQSHVGIIARQFRQVQGQTCPHDQGIDTAGHGCLHIGLVLPYGFHDVDCDLAVTKRQTAGLADFA